MSAFLHSLTIALLCVELLGIAYAADYESAHMLVARQKWSEAYPLLKSLHEEAPLSMMIGQDYAQVLIRMNRREEAIELLRKYGLNQQVQVIAKSFITQDSFKLYQDALNLIDMKKYSQACEKLDKAYQKDLGHLEILIRLVQCNVLDNNADQALKYSEILQKSYGKVLEVLSWNAKALQMKKQWESSVPLLQEALKQIPSSENSILWLSDAYLNLGQDDQAMESLKTYLRKNPDHLNARLTLLKIRTSGRASPTELQDIQKDLLSIPSQIDRYISNHSQRPEGDLGIDLRDVETITHTTQQLTERLKERLNPAL